MAKALSRFAILPPAGGQTLDPAGPPTGNALYLVLSSHDKWYGDHALVSEPTGRPKSVMRYMALDGDALPVKTKASDVNSIVDERFLVKRISNFHSINMHAKLVCVDRSLLYVGSDNQYPHYNEEFGCWIEEPAYVKSFFNEFYNGVWERSVLEV